MAELQDALDQLVKLSLKDKTECKSEEKADESKIESRPEKENYKVQDKSVEEKQEKVEEITWNEKKLLFFDLETTGLEKDCDIIQISAIHGSRAFDQYVFPTNKKIAPGASKVNGLTVEDGQLYYKKSRVKSVEAKEAMESFVGFIREAGEQVVLVAHNGHRFDVPHLRRVMDSVGVQLPSNVQGFLDSLLLARICYPDRKSYRQPDLVSGILGVSYEAHNAAADVKTLQSLVGAMFRERGDLEQDIWAKCFRPIRLVENEQ